MIVFLYFQIQSKMFLLQLGSQFTDHIAMFYTHLVQLLILRTELSCGFSEIICEQLDLFRGLELEFSQFGFQFIDGLFGLYFEFSQFLIVVLSQRFLVTVLLSQQTVSFIEKILQLCCQSWKVYR